MLSADRVIHMTKMAVFEEENGSRIETAIQYTKRDYVFTRVLSSVIIGTLIFVSAYALVFTVFFYLYADHILIEDVLTAVIAGLALYVLFLFIRLRITVIRSGKEYEKSKESLKIYKKDVSTLLRMYAAEELKKAPEELRQRKKDNDYTY